MQVGELQRLASVLTQFQVILHHLKRSCIFTPSPCQAVLLAFPEGTAAHGVNGMSSGTDLFNLCITQHGLVIPTFAIITSARCDALRRATAARPHTALKLALKYDCAKAASILMELYPFRVLEAAVPFPSRSGPTFSGACASQSWYQWTCDQALALITPLDHRLLILGASTEVEVLQEVCACEVLHRSLKQDPTDAPTMIANPSCDEMAFNSLPIG